MLTAHLLEGMAEDEVGADFANDNVGQGAQEL